MTGTETAEILNISSVPWPRKIMYAYIMTPNHPKKEAELTPETPCYQIYFRRWAITE